MSSAPTIIEVSWVDSLVAHGWTKEDRPPTAFCASVGYMLKEDEEALVLCAAIGDQDKLCVITIPKACILRTRKLGQSRYKKEL